jgi:uncharacterized membrane protein YgdD (TMEM256/DUF423 family)
MPKNYIAAGAFFGGLAVALGAFGAHGLQKMTTDESILHGFQTAVQYQVYHSLALLTVGIIAEKSPSRWIKWSAICFVAGVFLFSGSLYLLTYLKLQESDAIKFVGPVTPVGGLFFIAGWISLFIAAVRKGS